MAVGITSMPSTSLSGRTHHKSLRNRLRGVGFDMLVLCSACKTYIRDYGILKVDDLRFHIDCLRCQVCKTRFDGDDKCYTKDAIIYCKAHYFEIYGACKHCKGCKRPVLPGHWIRQSLSDTIYHLTCFCCVVCKRQLSTGEEYGCVSGSVYCLLHFKELKTDPQERTSVISKKKKSKRIRTTFTEHQIEILLKTFHIETNPDTTELERLADATSLSKRVIQVWFQNARARHKRFLTSSFSPIDSPTDGSVCNHLSSLMPTE